MACTICDDTGWKSSVVDGVSRVTRCDCIRESTGERLLAHSRIPKRYEHCTFENFTAYNEHLEKARRYASQLAERFPVVDKGMFLQGPPGVGKTHLAVAVLGQVIRTRGAVGLFYDTQGSAACHSQHLRPGESDAGDGRAAAGHDRRFAGA